MKEIKDKKYKYIYIVICTNKKSSKYGHYYIGKHSTNNLDDGYIASGLKITRYLKKYPNDYYRKILEYCDTEEKLNELEYTYIHGLLNTKKCLNLIEGGHGGKVSKKTSKKISDKLKGRDAYWAKGPRPEYVKDKISKTKQENKYVYTEEIKNKMSLIMKKRWEDPIYRQKVAETHKGQICPTKGKHKVWDNKELNIYHFE